MSYLSLSEAAQRAPGRPHTASIWRWMRKGVKARTGERVHLKHVRAGGKLYTTEEWLNSFLVALADADLAHFDAPPSPAVTTRRRAAELERTKARLAAAGLVEQGASR